MTAPAGAQAGPIGVFDSGIGGLTVVRALRQLLPQEQILYLGDTARVPYGGKSRQTIERYSIEITGLLLARRAKLVVAACNTASALALDRLREVFRTPVQGVIGPGAAAALAATRTGHVAVIGTKATIGSGAYERQLQALQPEVRVTSLACPLLVPLIEEGWFEDEVTRAVLHRYLDPLQGTDADVLVLGCTHYPLLKPAIASVVGPGITLVDSAENCALAVRDLLVAGGLQAPVDRSGSLEVAFTDTPDRFLRLAGQALNLDLGEITLEQVPSR